MRLSKGLKQFRFAKFFFFLKNLEVSAGSKSAQGISDLRGGSGVLKVNINLSEFGFFFRQMGFVPDYSK